MTDKSRQIRDAFHQLFTEGGYQYSESNMNNAQAWFRLGWLAHEAGVAEVAKEMSLAIAATGTCSGEAEKNLDYQNWRGEV